MFRFVILPAIMTFLAVIIREIDVGNVQTSGDFIFYVPLIFALVIVFEAIVLYNAQKGIIKDSSKFSRFKLSEKNILIRLRLFKYDNDTNYFFVIPLLLAWNIFLTILIVYMIYSFGVTTLKSIIMAQWFILFSTIPVPIFIIYFALIRELIFDSYKNQKPNFITDKEENSKGKD